MLILQVGALADEIIQHGHLEIRLVLDVMLREGLILGYRLILEHFVECRPTE